MIQIYDRLIFLVSQFIRKLPILPSEVTTDMRIELLNLIDELVIDRDKWGFVHEC